MTAFLNRFRKVPKTRETVFAMEEISIRVGDNREVVFAGSFCNGLFAIHPSIVAKGKNQNGYTITHVPTGTTVMKLDVLADARQAATLLVSELGPDCSDFESEDLKSNTPVTTRLRNAAMAVKRSLSTL